MKYIFYFYVLIILLAFYLFISFYTLIPPIYIIKSNNFPLQSNSTAIISGRLPAIFIRESINNKRLFFNNCVIIFSIKHFNVFLSEVFCYIPFFHYFIYPKQNTQTGEISFLHNSRWANLIKYSEKKFYYMIKENTIFINTKPVIDISNTDNELIYCPKIKGDGLLKNIIDTSSPTKMLEQYLYGIKLICLYINNSDVNILIKSNHHLARVLFRKAIHLYSKTQQLKKVNNHQYYMDFTKDIGYLVFLEQYKNYCLIRFSLNLKSNRVFKRMRRFIYKEENNNILIMHNFSLFQLINYIRTFMYFVDSDFNLLNFLLKKIKMDYKIYGILRW